MVNREAAMQVWCLPISSNKMWVCPISSKIVYLVIMFSVYILINMAISLPA